MSRIPKNRYYGIAQGQVDHLQAVKFPNLSKVGVSSLEVGVAKSKVGGAVAPKAKLVGRLPHKLCFLPHQLQGLTHQLSINLEILRLANDQPDPEICHSTCF